MTVMVNIYIGILYNCFVYQFGVDVGHDQKHSSKF